MIRCWRMGDDPQNFRRLGGARALLRMGGIKGGGRALVIRLDPGELRVVLLVGLRKDGDRRSLGADLLDQMHEP